MVNISGTSNFTRLDSGDSAHRKKLTASSDMFCRPLSRTRVISRRYYLITEKNGRGGSRSKLWFFFTKWKFDQHISLWVPENEITLRIFILIMNIEQSDKNINYWLICRQIALPFINNSCYKRTTAKFPLVNVRKSFVNSLKNKYDNILLLITHIGNIFEN